MTFSVNAAYKIKKDVLESFSELDLNPEEYLVIGNFHSLARKILKKYGYLLDKNFRNLENFKVISTEEIFDEVKIISDQEKEIISEFTNNLRAGFAPADFQDNLLEQYNGIVKKYLIDSQCITYDAILTFAIELLHNNLEIRGFYNEYFRIVIIDEFQDTNILGWTLVQLFLTEQTRKIFLGDSLQRIYGFIGAIPSLIDIVTEKFNMEYIPLTMNHRFSSNPELLNLEKVVRDNANQVKNTDVNNKVKINFSYLNTQYDESQRIFEIIDKILHENESTKIAILVKQRGDNINFIKQYLEANNINIFDGLFTDEDSEYLKFHNICLKYFTENFGKNRFFLKKDIEVFCRKIFQDSSNEKSKSFLELLKVALISITNEKNYFARNELIMDLFANKGLKNYLDKIDDNVMVTTVHASKGLEWDYILLPDMEQGLFPNYFGLCQKNTCIFKNNCNLKVTKNNESKFIEEISVFYVAITRAKKDIFFTASKNQLFFGKDKPANLSCLLSLPGILFK